MKDLEETIAHVAERYPRQTGLRELMQKSAVQEHYDECIRNGCSPKLAEMFSTGQAPSPRTDNTFLEGRWNQFEKTPWLGDAYKRVADAHGFDVKGKVYLSQLAEFPGDPRAWVSGRGDVQKVCEERGWGCSGSVSVKAQGIDQEPKQVAIADDIVQDRVESILEKLPAEDRPHVDTVDLTEQVKERIKPHWSK